MTFDKWYEDNIKKGQDWPWDHKQTDLYKQLKKVFYSGMRVGLNHGKNK